MSIHITIAPAADLHEARLPINEAGALYAAWSEAVDAIAEELRLTITTASVVANSPEDCTTRTAAADGDDIEPLIWQLAHDSVRRTEHGTWHFAGVDTRRISALRSVLPEGLS